VFEPLSRSESYPRRPTRIGVRSACPTLRTTDCRRVHTAIRDGQEKGHTKCDRGIQGAIAGCCVVILGRVAASQSPNLPRRGCWSPSFRRKALLALSVISQFKPPEGATRTTLRVRVHQNSSGFNRQFPSEVAWSGVPGNAGRLRMTVLVIGERRCSNFLDIRPHRRGCGIAEVCVALQELR
jgi:hypothetical protein